MIYHKIFFCRNGGKTLDLNKETYITCKQKIIFARYLEKANLVRRKYFCHANMIEFNAMILERSKLQYDVGKRKYQTFCFPC